MDLQKNDVIECPVDTLGIHGEGIAHVEGKTVFIRGALPGERVRAGIVFSRPTFCDARLISVLSPSPDRIKPDCPVFGRCGGCALRHMSYEAELTYKRERVKETFRKVAGLDVEPENTVRSSRVGCRNKFSLPVRGGNGKTVIGFFAAGSHRVVETSDCLLQPKWNARLIAFVKRFMAENNLTGYDEATGTGDVRHIVAREIAGNLYMILVVTDASPEVYRRLPRLLQFTLSRKVALYLNENRSTGNAILSGRFACLSSLPPVRVSDILMDVHPAGFFQVNDAIREKIYAAVDTEADGDEIIDAYAGAGLLSAVLARRGRKVTAVELDPAAARSAENTVRLNNLSSMKVVHGDCAEALPRLVTERSVVILDPPRSGCDAKALRAAALARKIVYISCNPATLARDVKILVDAGFTLGRVRPFDMFPATPHVETVVCLEKQ